MQLNISYFKSLLLISAIFKYWLEFRSRYTANGFFFLLFEFYNFHSEFSHQSIEKQKLLCRLDDSIIIQCQRCCEKQACTWCYQIKAFESPPSRHAVNEVLLSFWGQVEGVESADNGGQEWAIITSWRLSSLTATSSSSVPMTDTTRSCFKTHCIFDFFERQWAKWG